MSFETWTLEDAEIRLIDGDRGKNYPKQADFNASGHCLFLSAKNVTSSGFQFSDPVFIGKERHDLLRAGTLERGDIVMTTRGTIGNVAYYDSSVSYPLVRINSGMMIFRANQELWNTRFLYYVLTSPVIQDQITSLTSGSAVPQLPARDLKKFALPKVPLSVQNRIEAIISSLSDKLSLNQRINQTLEQMAQAIFKSWFVDFEPVKAKIAALEAGGSEEDALLTAMQAISGKGEEELTRLQAEQPEQYAELRATAELFPSAMQESELGEIPEGWTVGTLADVANLNQQSWTKRTIPSEIRYVDLANTKNGVIESTTTYIGDDAPSRARRILSDGDTIVGTVRPGNRSFAFIKRPHKTLTGSTGFAALSPKQAELAEFVYITATSDEAINHLAHLADGGAYPAVRPEVVINLPCIVPTERLIAYFHKTVRSFFDQAAGNKLESSTLSVLRDMLLLKLLSGELSVSATEDQLAEPANV